MSLSGSIDGDDFFRLDAGFGSDGSLAGYVNGDFDYSGGIDADDYFIIDRSYARQGTAFSAVTAVPEAVVGLVGMAGVMLWAGVGRRGGLSRGRGGR